VEDRRYVRDVPLVFRESFQITKGLKDAWPRLSNPEWVSACVPGLRNLQKVDDHRYRGSVELRFGPLNVTYDVMVQADKDDAACRGTISGTGKQIGAFGQAQGTLTYRLEGTSTTDTLVHVEVHVEISGKLASLGSGLVNTAARQLFKQFAECVRTRLDGET
jgi:carbon monoxide dehydrogenase subunit G